MFRGPKVLFPLKLNASKCRIISQSACPNSAVADPKPKKTFDTPEEYAKARPFSEMPGPSMLTFMSRVILPGGKYRDLGLKKLNNEIFKEYGIVSKLPLLGDVAVMLYDSEEVEKVYRNEGQWPNRKSFEFFEEFRMKIRPEIFKGNGGLLQSQGQMWQDTRTKVNPVLMQPKTITRYIGSVDTIAKDFITRIRSIRDEKDEAPADFGNEMCKWALESIAYVALDQRLGLLTNTPDPDGQRLIDSVHDFFDLSYKMEIGPPIWKYYHNADYKNMKKCLNTMTDVIIAFIDKSIADLETKTKGDTESVLEQLLKIDKGMAIIMALDMLMAGVDTTSNTMLSLLYMLAKNPEKQKILRQEIREKLPKKDSKLTADTLKNFPYLRACIKESQRIEPIIPGTMRKVEANVVLGGYQVPKGTYVVMPQVVMSMQEKNFKRPTEFIPERFLKNCPCPDLKLQHPFAFLPLGFGSRMCIGKRIADLELEILTSKLLRNFEVEWHYGEIKYGTTFINAPTGDMKFKFIEVRD